jgi:hypothetical protein
MGGGRVTAVWSGRRVVAVAALFAVLWSTLFVAFHSDAAAGTAGTGFDLVSEVVIVADDETWAVDASADETGRSSGQKPAEAVCGSHCEHHGRGIQATALQLLRRISDALSHGARNFEGADLAVLDPLLDPPRSLLAA